MTAPAAGVASPCISICQMHAASGWCTGCLRTLDEIAAWASLDDSGRRQVLQRLGARRVAWRARHQPTLQPGVEPGPQAKPDSGGAA